MDVRRQMVVCTTAFKFACKKFCGSFQYIRDKVFNIMSNTCLDVVMLDWFLTERLVRFCSDDIAMPTIIGSMLTPILIPYSRFLFYDLKHMISLMVMSVIDKNMTQGMALAGLFFISIDDENSPLHNLTIRGITAIMVSFLHPIQYLHNDPTGWLRWWSLFFAFAYHGGSLLLREDKPRVKSLLTFMVSCIVSPLALDIFVRLMIFGFHGVEKQRTLPIPACYIAFAFVDTLMGACCYPEYMMNLEGFAHHIVTGSVYAWYYSQDDERVLLCMAASMIVEVPTILLSGSSVFPQLLSLKRRFFPIVFPIFRIILTTFAMMVHYKECPTSFLVFYMLFLALNCDWYMKIRKKMVKQS